MAVHVLYWELHFRGTHYNKVEMYMCLYLPPFVPSILGFNLSNDIARERETIHKEKRHNYSFALATGSRQRVQVGILILGCVPPLGFPLVTM